MLTVRRRTRSLQQVRLLSVRSGFPPVLEKERQRQEKRKRNCEEEGSQGHNAATRDAGRPSAVANRQRTPDTVQLFSAQGFLGRQELSERSRRPRQARAKRGSLLVFGAGGGSHSSNCTSGRHFVLRGSESDTFTQPLVFFSSLFLSSLPGTDSP